MATAENTSITLDAPAGEEEIPAPQATWFVMRDLKRPNAKLPAYKQLTDLGFDLFTPMKQILTLYRGRKVREEVPFMQDLLFVHSFRSDLDPVVERTPTLQYRFLRGAGYRVPMTVDPREMDRFIHAVRNSEDPQYYLPEEITPKMYGRRIRIKGGELNDYEGELLTVRGSRTKRLLVVLENVLAVAIEVEPEYIEFI